MTLLIPELKDLPAAAQVIAPLLRDAKTIAFHGTMGAGKTTLIKALCEVFGVKDTVNSPTFALVNEYSDGKGDPLYHFDFYRIQKLEEVFDLGYEEYFYSGCLCFIEWPELIAPLLPADTSHIYIDVKPDGTREITL